MTHFSYFEHHGIKGQKWGVRRTPEQLGHVKKSRKSKHGDFLGQSYDHDIVLPKGSIGYRISGTKNVDLKKPLYLSYDKSDFIKYTKSALDLPDYGIAPNAKRNLGGWSYDTELYACKLTAKEEIKAPSYTNAIKVFVELAQDKGINSLNPYDSTSINGKAFVESYLTRGKHHQTGPGSAYTRFVNSLSRSRNQEVYQDFKALLEKKGYNALVDPEDRIEGSRDDSDYPPMYKAPMIILNPEKTLRIETRRLSKSEKKYISDNYMFDNGDVNFVDDQYKKEDSPYKNRHPTIHKRYKEWFNE